MSVSQFISKVIGPKRRWREYKARTQELPANYRMAVDAIERYLMHFGGTGDTKLFEDLIDLFEQGAAHRTPIRELVGEDPVAFIEGFARNYPEFQYVLRERERLVDAIERAAGADTGN